MHDRAADIARKLAEQAEAVCRHYLASGRREGRYWLVGDADNTPGRSLFVRLTSNEAAKPAGKWTDAATGEHGDLLDIIARRERMTTLRETLDAARRFLALPHPEPTDTDRHRLPAPTGSPEAARRLFAMSKPIVGTLAETYLRARDIGAGRDCTALRYHPRCWYRGDDDDPADQVRDSWPALIAAVTDEAGIIAGAHRTWLDPSGMAKAPVSTPRRAMGWLLGNGVRFGKAHDVLAAGEGIETMLSLRSILPAMPMVAALSANHLAALHLPKDLRRLYIAQDNDPAGRHATATLAERAHAIGIETLPLIPALGDFNDDLRQLGPAALAEELRVQLAAADINARVTDTLTIYGGYGLADSKITDIDSLLPADRAAIIGNRIPFAADYNVTAGAQLLQPLTGALKLLARADYTRSGSIWYDQRNAPNTRRDPIDLVNARLGLQTDRWELVVWTKNLLDKSYNSDAVVILPVAHAVFRAPGRSYGLEAKVKF
jgi:hypothetical protein